MVLLVIAAIIFLPAPKLSEAVRLVVGLAWPAVVLLVAWLYQADIREKVRDLLRAAIGKLQVEFKSPAQPQSPGDPASPRPISFTTGQEGQQPSDRPALSPLVLPHELIEKLTGLIGPAYRALFREHLMRFAERAPMVMSAVGLSDRDAAMAWACELSASIHLEKASRFIFQSQVEALEALKGRSALTVEDFRPYYEAATKTAPEIYKSYTFEMWLNYLKNFELISIQPTQVEITNAGAAIAQYMKDRQYDGGLEKA